MPVVTYRKLDVWKLSVDFVVGVYQLTKQFPAEERFGLAAQIQRASVSVPSNIAEGYGRSHRAEYLHHLAMARGSLMEVETQLIIARRLGYITRESALEVWRLAQQVGRRLNRLIQKLQPGNTP